MKSRKRSQPNPQRSPQQQAARANILGLVDKQLALTSPRDWSYRPPTIDDLVRDLRVNQPYLQPRSSLHGSDPLRVTEKIATAAAVESFTFRPVHFAHLPEENYLDDDDDLDLDLEPVDWERDGF